ncbi:MAG: GNAT family N-acetyltransferase [Proteobacteria bacterium]|nr:GNAT family N-acetyltransferase [Pseudomonadota bacterium]
MEAVGDARPRIELAGADDLLTCWAIRRQVFVEGQGVPEAIDRDGLDGACTHFLAHWNQRPVGTARLRPLPGEAKAERVAVVEAVRGLGVGRLLMEALETHAARTGFPRLVLHAQESAIDFYTRLGYEAEGERFLEADILHLAMAKRLHPRRGR